MNCLAIDYGTKRIGLAISVMDIIKPLSPIKNDAKLFDNLKQIILEYCIEKVFVGMSEGLVADKTKKFVGELSAMLQLSVETVEEAVSTIEADEIFLSNKKKNKDYKKLIDSIAAAVILRRALG